jgi:hypothetical protein
MPKVPNTRSNRSVEGEQGAQGHPVITRQVTGQHS